MAGPEDSTTDRCEHCGAESAHAHPEPWRVGRWLRRAVWLLIPAGALAWSCSPGFVAISLIGDVAELPPAPGRASTPEHREQCRAGIERLDRARAVAKYWPPLRDVLDVHHLVYRRAELLECAGDVAGARDELRAEIARLESDLPAGPIDWEQASPDELRAVQVPSYWRALADLEERSGDGAAALAAYEGQVAVSVELDGSGGWGPFTADAATDLLRYLVRTGDRDRAREVYRTYLGTAEASGADDEMLLPLLEAYAELLEVEGSDREATEIYSRIGRLAQGIED